MGYIELASIIDGGNRDIILYGAVEPAVTRNHSHHSNCKTLCGLKLGIVWVWAGGAYLKALSGTFLMGGGWVRYIGNLVQHRSCVYGSPFVPVKINF